MKAHEPCAMCARFTRKDEQQAAAGNGWCVGYERYVRADAHPSVLFKAAPAGQVSERRSYLAQYQGKQMETA